MERKFHWNWSIFDRCVGVFAAACTAVAAYYTYRGPNPETVATKSAPAGASIMMTPAPWWALALLGLSAILLVVSLTRAKRAATERGVFLPFDEKTGIPHISTPELERNLRTEIAALEERLKTQVSGAEDQLRKDLENQIAEVNDRFGKTMIGIPTGLATKGEIPKLADVEGQQKFNMQIAADLHGVSEELKAVTFDLVYLLTFAVDNVTVRFLDWIISLSPMDEPLVDYDDASAREAQCHKLEEYIRRVRTATDQTFRGQRVNEVLHDAERDAEEILRKTPQSERPVSIDPLDLRRYAIVEMKCLRLVAFLRADRLEVISRLMNSRPGLRERLHLRDPS